MNGPLSFLTKTSQTKEPSPCLTAVIAAALVFALTACAASQTQQQPQGAGAEAAASEESQTQETTGAADAADAYDTDPEYAAAKAAARAEALPADYDHRIDIWEHPAGYSTENKADRMNISERDWLEVTQDTSGALINREFDDVEEIIDSFYNGYIIGNGLELETFEDSPYVIPYPVEDAYAAVIVVPGGGFSYKTLYGHTIEGKEVAESLNRAGYTAFVLNYRSNPYEYPVPELDVQRAVRYVRAHADEYGFPAEHIALMGYSAGGYLTGFFINRLMGEDLFPEDYTPDDIDRVDDTVFAAGLIYPMLDFRFNVPMLMCQFDADQVRDDEMRERLLDETDLTLSFDSVSVPQFLAYGLKDITVGTESQYRYLTAARKAGARVAELRLDDQRHLFAQEHYMDAFLKWLRKQF